MKTKGESKEKSKVKGKAKIVKKGRAQQRDEASLPAAQRPAAATEPKPTTAASKPETEDERKARRNLYLREWRKSHNYSAYMKAWREKRDAAAGKGKSKTTARVTKKAAGKKAAHDERSGSAETTATQSAATESLVIRNSPDVAAAPAQDLTSA